MRPLYDCIKEEKSEADKMFEELGYEKNGKEDKEFIIYSKKEIRYKAHKEWEVCIIFDCLDKCIMTKNKSYFSLKELGAINEKVLELKWI